MSKEHPAMAAARHSWDCVQRKDREAWLGAVADDVVIEDPIGVAPTNPTGQGYRGREDAEKFWDTNIGRTESISIEAHESFCAGNESAHVLTLTTRFPGGTAMIVHGIFVYVVDDAGRIRNLRGYWSLDQAKVVKES